MTTTKKRGRRTERAVYAVMIVLGVVLLFFTGYQVLHTTDAVGQSQDRLQTELDRSWQATSTSPAIPHQRAPATPAEEPAPPVGSPVATLGIPRLGLSWVVVEGVSDHELAAGPGHYRGSAMPGRPGNFAVAGHRSPGVFWDLDDLVPGDEVTVETKDMRAVYRVGSSEVVTPDRSDVLDPEPGRSELTLTTCDPVWSDENRLIVHADLVQKVDKSTGAPAAL